MPVCRPGLRNGGRRSGPGSTDPSSRRLASAHVWGEATAFGRDLPRRKAALHSIPIYACPCTAAPIRAADETPLRVEPKLSPRNAEYLKAPKEENIRWEPPNALALSPRSAVFHS